MRKMQFLSSGSLVLPLILKQKHNLFTKFKKKMLLVQKFWLEKPIIKICIFSAGKVSFQSAHCHRLASLCLRGLHIPMRDQRHHFHYAILTTWTTKDFAFLTVLGSKTLGPWGLHHLYSLQGW